MAERSDDEKQLRIEFEAKLRELDALAGTLGLPKSDEPRPDDKPARGGKQRGKRKDNRGTGRRDLRQLPLEEDRVEIADPHLEQLVLEGKVVRHGVEESYKLGHKRATKVRVFIARVRYKTVDAQGATDVITTAMPSEMLPRAIIAPSLSAHVIMGERRQGHAAVQARRHLREGIPIDRGTLARMKKRVGDTLATSVVTAMRKHAVATAFCISTDATGVCIQPIASHEKGSQPCKEGHFLVMIADRAHIVFEYLEKENGASIYERFRGFDGYVQADAKAVFNLLFAGEAELKLKTCEVEHDGCERVEVGCWYHCPCGGAGGALGALARQAGFRWLRAAALCRLCVRRRA